MATSASVNITADLVYSVTDTIGGNTSRINENIGYSRALVYGTGNPPTTTPSQVNLFGKTQYTVTAGTSTDLDFTSIPYNTNGIQYTGTLDGGTLKGLVVSNDTNSLGADVVLSAPATSGLTGVFGSGGSYTLHSLGCFTFSNIWGTDNIGSTNKIMRATNNSATDVTLSAIFVGVNSGLTEATIPTP